MSVPQAEPEKKGGCCLLTLLKIGLVLILLIVAVVVSLGFFADGSYTVSRDVTIKASPADVHKQVGDLREWPNWLPFTKHDPTIKVTIDKPTGVGAEQHWTGNSGSGELKFTSSDEDKGIEFDMVFDGKYKSTGTISFARVGDDTKVTWRMVGQTNDFTGRLMALATPAMVGPMFDEGLADLKKKVEAK